MDHLSYDLVEEVVTYLPPTDVKTIARVASRSPELEYWGIAAEDQLDNRFLLDVDVIVQELNPEDNDPKVRLSVKKILSDDTEEPWNFKQWRFAWIRNVTIKMCTDAREVTDGVAGMDEVLRVVSLPIDPSAQASLKLTDDCTPTFFIHDTDRDTLGEVPESPVAGLSWKLLWATQKAFAKVDVQHPFFKNARLLEEVVTQYIRCAVFLEELDVHGRWGSSQLASRNLSSEIAPLFGQALGRPLSLRFPSISFRMGDVARILKSWLKSDGIYEEKVISVRRMLVSLSDLTNQKKFSSMVVLSRSGYLAHPSKGSTLCIDHYQMSIEEFEPWHVPVSFEWIDSVIEKWKKGDGFYVYAKHTDLYFVFEEADDWEKLVEKYGPPAKRKGRRSVEILHPKRGRRILGVVQKNDTCALHMHDVLVSFKRLYNVASSGLCDITSLDCS
uniref:F-box domain-containing protein n=1 Tax=Steinernema glaseri TaxID=37863 RepID=A0A1I7YVC5_9BILA